MSDGLRRTGSDRSAHDGGHRHELRRDELAPRLLAATDLSERRRILRRDRADPTDLEELAVDRGIDCARAELGGSLEVVELRNQRGRAKQRRTS